MRNRDIPRGYSTQVTYHFLEFQIGWIPGMALKILTPSVDCLVADNFYSLDGPDDIFSLGSLPQRLSSLRGKPYAYHEQLAVSESSGQSTMSPLGSGSMVTPGSFSETSQNYPSSLMYALDGYFEFEASSSGSQAMSGNAHTEPCEGIGQDLIDSVRSSLSEFR